ncbi:DJ-1/PfpI family protein [Nioella aestuarii]|uniref:DJ-1/PfpI family protein n=1 Tax=Nioella aestuarii TaxID=1662864 RepID=UPI003D7FA27A
MRRIGALIFPGFELLDLFGPMEMFGMLTDEYSLELIAETAGPIRGNPGLDTVASRALEDAGDYDLLFVPGGPGTRALVDHAPVLDWLAEQGSRAEYVLSVCTGSALLARAGLLDGCKATTNKAAFAWVASQGPQVNWVKQARWVEDGKFLTSSGVSAGMDMTLAAIALMHGRALAEEVAVSCEYTWHDDSTADPFAALHGLA